MLHLHRRAASAQVLPNAIEVELIGDAQASAYGYVVTSPSPLIALARGLLEGGDDAACLGHLPMVAYRGDTLCLIASSVAAAAALEVNGQGTGFIRAPKRRRGSPMRQNEFDLPTLPPTP